MYLFGWSMACLFVPRLGDLYGRRLPFLISNGISLLAFLGLMLSNNITLTTGLFFLLGTCTPGKSSIGYIYLLELIPSIWKTYVGTSLLFADGSTMIFLSLYFRYINKNWLWLEIFAFFLMIISHIGLMLVPESPKYLYSYKKFSEAKKSINRIAIFNGIPIS